MGCNAQPCALVITKGLWQRLQVGQLAASEDIDLLLILIYLPHRESRDGPRMARGGGPTELNLREGT